MRNGSVGLDESFLSDWDRVLSLDLSWSDCPFDVE